MNRGPHIRLSVLKVDHMEQNWGSFIDFPKNFDKKTPSLATKRGYLHQKIVTSTFWFHYFIDLVNT